jgi:hypothetical protein
LEKMARWMGRGMIPLREQDSRDGGAVSIVL